MKKTFIIVIGIIGGMLLSSGAWGQISSWSLTSDGNASGVNSNISAGVFSATGVGAVTFGTNGAWASTWATGGIETDKYFEISITPNAGYTINVTELNFGERRSNTGIRDYQVRWSIDNFSNNTNIATVNVPDNDSERTRNITGLNIDVADGETLKIRWYGYNAEAIGGTWRINDGTLNIVGTVTANSSTPTITLTPTSLTGFNYTKDAGPSTEQTFTVEGTNLTADISIAAPTNYEISLSSGSGYTTPITLTQTGGTVSSTTVYVRLKSGLAVGTYNSEDITLSSAGATNKTVTCSGEVTNVPSIAISTPGVSAASVGQGTNNHILQKINLAVTLAPTQLNSLTITTAGTYIVGDLKSNSFKLWYSTDATFSVADDLLSTQAIEASGQDIEFTSLTQDIAQGTTGYFFITCDFETTATVGNTINITSAAFANITLSGGNKTGANPVAASGTQTIIAATPANVFISEYAGYGMVSGTWNNEYIELSNTGGTAQDLTGWTLEYYESAIEVTLDLTGSIDADSAYVIAVRTTYTSLTPDFVPISSFSLNNAGYVILKNSGTVVD